MIWSIWSYQQSSINVTFVVPNVQTVGPVQQTGAEYSFNIYTLGCREPFKMRYVTKQLAESDHLSLMEHIQNFYTSPTLEYPTLQEVASATVEQLAEWYRLLPSPGVSAAKLGADYDHFKVVMNREAVVLNEIIKRFEASGGWTPELSRRIEWRTKT